MTSRADELAEWCEKNSSGAYRKSAEAAAELRRLAAEVESLKLDASRYRWVRSKTCGDRDSRGRMEFHLPAPHPLGNIMKGSVAQHLDATIDAAMKGES